MSWLIENWFELASLLLGLLASLYAIGLLIAPKTETKWDDKIVAGLGWVLGLGRKLIGRIRQ